MSNCKILWNNENAYKFATKSALFGYFWARILKKYRHVWNQHLPISVIAKFCEETKMPISGTKNALFGYFWQRMSYLGVFGQKFWKNYCHIWNPHPQICLIAKFCRKAIMPKFGNKNALFGYFWAKILKKLLSYLKSTLDFV